MNKTKSSRIQISGCALLTIIFIILKLTGNIAWSWWWIFAPLWIPYAIIFSILICIAGFVFGLAFLALIAEMIGK